ncbi:hypothetical protein BKA82DRAFT_21845 [Pisolithus tinctorius]|uniref:Uncharacterized protein n=1 Tax=Pisolithus tinctorius Marx 270 TaxID=870435 RepID=A0A0C3PMY2_PISTI|nr:hypothetical protein BKA82DRAFT_21845 [Pisolithus tinctorius]KIO10176.1 hypothetical protein M404DRAFT_21845 [Pisolithus tinctorius Marx 270]
MNYVCRQRKEVGREVLSPSQYDTITTSLPPSLSPRVKHVSEAEQPSPQHPSPSSSKAV